MKPDEAAPRSNQVDASAPQLAELVTRAQHRDTEAFRMLVELHQDRAYSLALRMLRSPSDAEEVTQDAFVRAWTALPAFRGESSFGTWLHRIVARRAIDRATVLRGRRQREIGVDEAERIPAPATEPDPNAARLKRLIAGLGDAQRAAVTLFYYEGRSVEQIAGMLGMPAGTVKTHLSRARAALRGAWLREDRAGGAAAPTEEST